MIERATGHFVRLIVLALVLASLVASTGHGHRASAEDADSVVTGRLGGTLGSFIKRFGEPESYNAAVGPIFAIDGFGYVAARVTENRPENPILRITISSDRPLELGSTEPDPADWTIEQATEAVLTFLPTDVEISAFVPDESGQLSAVCHSDALEAIDPSSKGACRIAFVSPTPDTVSYASMTMIPDSETSDAATPVTTPCTGAAEWIATAGSVLNEVQSLLGQVSNMSVDDPNAVQSLKEIAESFRQLAANQRGSDPPKQAAQANFYLVSALTTYAKAIDTAANALEANDSDLADEAVSGIDDARQAISHATDEIESLGQTCGLELGTPVPEASPSA